MNDLVVKLGPSRELTLMNEPIVKLGPSRDITFKE